MPAAVMGDMAVCTGPPDTILKGSMGVMIGGKPAARMGDTCAHGGTIVLGAPTVLIGEMMPSPPPVVVVPPMVPAAPPASTQAQAMTNAAARGAPFCEVCEKAKEEKEKEQAKKEEPKTFVEIQLNDAEGNPASGAKYKIELPDGSVKLGFLDVNGHARVDGVDPGNCKITFPQYDEKDWKKS
jgi:hypothetical protein